MARRAALPILLATALVTMACSAWHPAGTASEGVTRAKSGEIRVYRADGSMIRLVNASIVGDSLIGISPSTGARISMPTSAVISTETKQISGGRTALLGGGIVLGVIAVTGILAIALILSSWN